jgi:DNA-binding NtrC family response regulator
VVVMTAFGTVETAVSAMKAGASDYISKPIDLDELQLLIERISGRRTIVRENIMLRKELRGKRVTPDGIIFRSTVMAEVINMVGRVAKSRATVLIQGESGTGKELIARLIHDLSSRCEKPMTVVNCAALPENLLESELFGHEKGAFTGASGIRLGRFEEADGGTLFLDEIGELTTRSRSSCCGSFRKESFSGLAGTVPSIRMFALSAPPTGT